MPLKTLMTRVPGAKRCAKNYRGKANSVSRKQLGVPPTKEESAQAENAWWQARQRELDAESRPPIRSRRSCTASFGAERRRAT
jgi:hypothetical protein